MPATISGIKNRVIRQISERFETDRFGVDSIQLSIEMPDGIFPGVIAPMFSAHPRFPAMKLSRRSGSRDKPGFWMITYLYEGFLFELPQPVYELSAGLDQEPIASHPNFISAIGGKPSAVLNGAVFIDPDTGLQTEVDADGVFREFAATIGGAANKKGGIESYLVPGAEWRVTEFSTSRPSALRDLGRIDSPDGPNPTLAGRNWLFWGESYVRRGHIYQTTAIWKLSGRNGWDSDIYGA